MDETLAKIDAIRKRTNVTYERAREALEKAGGDVVSALTEIEKSSRKKEVMRVRGEDLLRTVAAIIRRGNASRIVIKKGDSVVMDIPVTIGVVATILAPWLTLLGTTALLVSTWTLEIERPEDDSEMEPTRTSM
ncbi:MAG TPA: DUF4342 domain-containing protein [Firmicutes bacterium]|nr:DUF4342 domain-containing protein [Candidatus Fermentithermobacillaceae bacterium]